MEPPSAAPLSRVALKILRSNLCSLSVSLFYSYPLLQEGICYSWEVLCESLRVFWDIVLLGLDLFFNSEDWWEGSKREILSVDFPEGLLVRALIFGDDLGGFFLSNLLQHT